MYFHMCSMGLCINCYSNYTQITTCAKDVIEFFQSMFCRGLIIGHTNNFLTSIQSRTAACTCSQTTNLPTQAGPQWHPVVSPQRTSLGTSITLLRLGKHHTSGTSPTTSIIPWKPLQLHISTGSTLVTLDVSSQCTNTPRNKRHCSLRSVPQLKRD